MICETIQAAVVRQAEETEEQIVAACRQLVGQVDAGKWEIGRLAHAWTRRFAKGRTDADFAELVGLSEDQVQRRRKVFSTYSDISASMRNLSWTHYLTVLAWDDADEWLAVADENGWSVAVMKRMRDIQQRTDNGDDLTAHAEPVDDDDAADEDIDGAGTVPVKRSSERRTVDRQDTGSPRRERLAGAPTLTASSDDAVSLDKTDTAPNLPTIKPTTLRNAIDNIAALVTALKPQLDGTAGHRLAAQLRRWADEIESPPETATKPTTGNR
ncbi:MAG: hypothetical protein HQ518_33170 [Rhodopirellula sp.]|nr:hypothetical protein [Rhodopirellula sp.]